MISLVTLLFFKVEGQNLVESSILMCFLQKMALIFKFRASMTSLLCHNRKYGRLCNFVVYQGKRTKFGRLGYFDVYFSKTIYFLKLKASMTSL